MPHLLRPTRLRPTNLTGARITRNTGRLAYWMILLWSALGVASLATNQLPQLFLHQSIGYGDSYIFQTVEGFRRTGVIYPEVGAAHLTPTLYSPLLYLMHAAAWAAVPVQNPYVGPRIVELLWYLLCVAAAALLTRELIPGRRMFALALLLAASFSTMTFWVMQLRSDFPGIACSLLALYLLMRRHPAAMLCAGACAGLAMQFKITFGAAAAAGVLWLLYYRRWRDLLGFALTAALFSAGGYAVFAWREPEMLANITMLSRILAHPAGVLYFFRQILAEPVFLLGLAALLVMLPGLLFQPWPRWRLLLIFLPISLGIAGFTSLQSGASINYFYESLFVITPFAVYGLLQLRAGRLRSAGVFLGLLLLVSFVLPRAVHTVRDARRGPGEIAARNRNYDALQRALAGTEVLSSVPDVTILLKDRIIADPYLLSYRVMTTGANLSPLAERIRRNEFDAVVTLPADYSWRGLPQLAPQIRAAVMNSYRPYCLLDNMLFHLPQQRESALEQRLRGIGCATVTCGPGSKCPGLGVAVEAFQP